MNMQTFEARAMEIIAILKSASAKLAELGKKHEIAAKAESFKKAT